MTTLVITTDDLREINKATFDAFIQSSQYALSKSQAYKQFGKVNIDILITNKLLKNTSELPGKNRYLLCDIITAFAIWKRI